MSLFRIRPATADDEQFLTDMLYAALFVPAGSEPPPRSIVDNPDLARYVSGFGTQLGDTGVVAELARRPIGAAWLRVFPAAAPGYGFVDPDTPELSIAVAADHRGVGVGEALLTALLENAPRSSLSVDAKNPALRLYERHGFAPVRRNGESITMLRPG